MDDTDEREEEISTLQAIFPELAVDDKDKYSLTLELPVVPAKPLLIRFAPPPGSNSAYVERDVELSHLPPLSVRMTLPVEYPAEKPPHVRLESTIDWLPATKLRDLEKQAESLWEQYGRCPSLYVFIDYLQQTAERGFDLDESPDGCLVLPPTSMSALVKFDSDARQAEFDANTYICTICLDPKKGTSCYCLPKCGHVFCRSCLQDFYNNAITEGDVASVKCLSPDCGKDGTIVNGRPRRKKLPALRPSELFAIGIDATMVRRYVEMKRKKKLETDKTTVWCPRTWCQGAAKSKKFPRIPLDLDAYEGFLSSEEEPTESMKPPDRPTLPAAPADRLAVCEKCSFAFCCVCYRGWHGEFARCYPRNPNELSAEEKASYDYIRLNTTPCPTCNSPTQKTMGCNHMQCFQCNSHFCYLCTSWLDMQNPYQHFNKPGTECYQRLWELEEGDEGQPPGDGRGFVGGRNWEQMALDAAREAEAQEALAAAQVAEDARVARELEEQEAVVAVNAEMQRVRIEPGGGRNLAQRARQNGAPRPQHPAQAAAPARPRRRRAPAWDLDGGGDEPQAPRELEVHIQRFVDMAQRDEEDGWDSDELGDDDRGFQIR